MTKVTCVVVLSLLLAIVAFAKGPVQPALEDVCVGYADPILSLWPADQVTWTEVATAPQAIGRSASGVLGDWFYNFGCGTGNFAQAYNMVTNTWVASTPAPLGYDNWCGVAVPPENALFVIGRYSGSYGNETQKFTPDGSGTGTWAQMAPKPVASCGTAAAWDGGDYIYAAGGNPSTAATLAHRYSISGNSWETLAPMPLGRAYCGGAYVNGKFYVYGGTVAAAANTIVAYDPTTNTWDATLPNLPTNVWFSTFSTTSNDGLLMSVGGGGGYGSWPATDQVQLYDPVTNTWSLETPLPVAYGVNSARYAGPGIVIDAGGYLSPTYYGNTYWGTDFPGGADPMAPAAPTNFTVSNNGPVLTASLAWTNPTETVNGSPLTTIDNVIVMRGQDIIATLTGNPGDPMTYDDDVPAADLYNYKVYCTNSYGDGLAASANAWIGLDVPGAVTNLVGAGQGEELIANLTWDNPTEGAHQGYWPPGTIDGYTINRYGPSPATFNLPGVATSYTDNTVPVQGWYHYGVIAYDASGPGPEAMSNTFYVGPPEFEPIPYDWVEINPGHPGGLPGTNANIVNDDQNVGPFNIGFNFPFYDGTSFNQIRICSNGWASFTSTVTAYYNVAIPNVNQPNNLLAPYWDDMNPSVSSGGYGTYWYYYDAANSRFIVEFDSLNHFGSAYTGEYFTFEAILYPDGTIDYQYRAIVPGTVTPFPSATVGIENATGTVGVQTTYNGSGPLEPESEMGIRIESVSQPPDISVTLVPFVIPIQIPANGGSFEFYAFVTNNESTAQQVTLWTEQIMPDSTLMSPLMGPATITLQPGTRGWYRVQNVASTAPAGIYTYIGNAGIYPDQVWGTDSFQYEKLTTTDAGPWINDWNNYGDPLVEEVGGIGSLVPTEFALISAHPNPFNPTTTIGFALPEAALVKLTVYDVSGRVVATLVNGWREAGWHDVTFDGSNLSSGLYIYTLIAGDHTATGKMVMMK